MHNDDEYEELARWMDVLAAEYARTHDENIKARIFAIASQLADLRKAAEKHQIH